MAIDLSGERINPIFSHMEDVDCDRLYPLSYYYVGVVAQRLFDLPVHRLAFLCDMIFCYCDSSCTGPEQELSELIEGFFLPSSGVVDSGSAKAEKGTD